MHCAPSHRPDDFNLCLKHGIKAIETVDGDGKYTKNVHLFEGNHIFKANPIIIEKLKEQKKLLTNGELTHSYPHSIIYFYRVIFVRIEKCKKIILKTIKI